MPEKSTDGVCTITSEQFWFKSKKNEENKITKWINNSKKCFTQDDRHNKDSKNHNSCGI